MFTMSEGRARFIDATCKVIALIGIGAGAGWTLYTYFNARAKEGRTALIEARKPFEAERLTLYLRATTAVGAILANRDPKDNEQAMKEFWTVYYGPLSIVQDDAVASSMAQIGQCLSTHPNCEKSLSTLVLQLDKACRLSIAESWDIYLPDDAITFDRMERLRN
jgi:hypothetical protein